MRQSATAARGQTPLEPNKRKFVLPNQKPGYRPAAWLTERICRAYPSVILAWNWHFHRWMLLNRVAGGWDPICIVQTQAGGYAIPNYTNTVQWLNDHSTYNLRNRFRFEAWMRGFDDPEDMQRQLAEEAAAERIREGSKDLYNVMSGRLVVPRAVAALKRERRLATPSKEIIIP